MGRLPLVRRRPVLMVTLGVILIALMGLGVSLVSPIPDHAQSYITDRHGRAVVLRGFNTAGMSKVTPDGLPPYDFSLIDRERADMGTNFVRFIISWRSVMPERGVIDEQYLDGVARWVEQYEQRGYHVMLDMHQDVYGFKLSPERRDTVGTRVPAWADFSHRLPIGDHTMPELYYLEPGVVRGWDTFWNTTGANHGSTDFYVQAWRAVAQRFAESDAVVAYDLMNEPFGGSLQGPVFEGGPLSDLYDAAIAAIREVDTSTWVCVEPQAVGGNWGTPTGLRKPVDSAGRVAYCPHLYPLPIDLGGGYATQNNVIEQTLEAWKTHTLRAAQSFGGVPIILGEVGLDTTKPGAEKYLDRVNEMSGEVGMGLAYWARDPGDWGPYTEDGQPRNLVEMWDRPYPRAIAGSLMTWSTSTRRLEFTYRPDPTIKAPTEVYLPKSTFTHAPNVDGTTVRSWNAETRILILNTPRDIGDDGEVRISITA